MPRRALITGITGQDGSYLAELLLSKGYEVHGIVRRVASEDSSRRLGRIQHLLDRIRVHAGSIECQPSVFDVVDAVRPHECYHLAAQSSVAYGAEDEFQTWQVNVSGTHYLLSAVRRLAPSCRCFFAASSELFAIGEDSPRTEESTLRPRSLYGVTKLAGFELARYYRERYGIFVSSGLLFNHESPRRGAEFVTRKITATVSAIAAGKAETLNLWNLSAARDWGAACDFVEGMWLMLQADDPQDFVLATGQTRTVGQFVETAFTLAGLDWTRHVAEAPPKGRPRVDEPVVTGDPSKAIRVLKWRHRTTFAELVRAMLEADLRLTGIDPRTVLTEAPVLIHTSEPQSF